MRSTSTREVGEVAVVDADQVGIDGLERALELLLVVHLDEDVEVELRAPAPCSGASVVVVERGDDQQDRVGARDRGLDDLVGVDDEVLAQDRQRAGRARLVQVVERAAEVALLGQDRQRGRAGRARRRARSRRPSSPGGCSPALGERRLNSAITEMPGCVSASWNGRSGPRASRPALELGERDGRRRRRARPRAWRRRCGRARSRRPPLAIRARLDWGRVNHPARPSPAVGTGPGRPPSVRSAAPSSTAARAASIALGEAVGHAAGVDRGARVEQGDVAPRPGLAGQDRADDHGVLLRCPADRRRRESWLSSPDVLRARRRSARWRLRRPRPRGSGRTC